MSTTLAQTAHGDITFGSTNPSTGTAAYGSNVTNGNYSIVGIVFRDTNNNAPGSYTLSVTDTLGLTYTQAANFNYWNSSISRNSVCYIYAAPITSSGANTVSVTISAGLGTCKGGLVSIFELSGVLSVTPENTANGGHTGGNGSPTLGNLTWTTTDPFCVAVMDDIQSGATPLFTPINAAISYNTSTSQNDTFGAMWFTAVSSSYGPPPTNFSCNSDPFTESGWAGLSASFPGGRYPVASFQANVNIISCCS
jgi:hypothetical protein